MNDVNRATPHTPVDVSSAELRRSTWRFWLMWVALYVPGFIAGKLLKVELSFSYRMPWSAFWVGFAALIALYCLVRFAYERLSAGRAFPDGAAAAIVAFLIGIWNGLS